MAACEWRRRSRLWQALAEALGYRVGIARKPSGVVTKEEFERVRASRMRGRGRERERERERESGDCISEATTMSVSEWT